MLEPWRECDDVSLSGIGVPWTVAFAPRAVTAPKVPTMKYWKTLFWVSPPVLRYFLKSGMWVVSLWLLVPRKGLV
jgi:hypothetical protein